MYVQYSPLSPGGGAAREAETAAGDTAHLRDLHGHSATTVGRVAGHPSLKGAAGGVSQGAVGMAMTAAQQPSPAAARAIERHQPCHRVYLCGVSGWLASLACVVIPGLRPVAGDPSPSIPTRSTASSRASRPHLLPISYLRPAPPRSASGPRARAAAARAARAHTEARGSPAARRPHHRASADRAGTRWRAPRFAYVDAGGRC